MNGKASLSSYVIASSSPLVIARSEATKQFPPLWAQGRFKRRNVGLDSGN
ncbi:MAG: hypothetical protein ABIK18_02645 [candidate division WOR-3 bacterium]